MVEFQVSEMSKKLGKISEVMSDGFHFIQMRAFCEQWQTEADAGNADSQEMIRIINTFHRLCVVVENR